jgi:hypothetical protein
MPFIIPQRPSFDASTLDRNICNPTALQAFGVLTDDGEPQQEAFHYRGDRCLTDTISLQKQYIETSSFEQLSGSWFFGGVLFSHFGHFFTESIHRLRSYTENPGEFDGVIFLKSPHSGTFSYNPLDIKYIRAILTEYFNIDREQILFVDSCIEVERLTCFRQEQQLGTTPKIEYVDFLGRLERAYLQNKDEPKGPEKIFFSRKNYLKAGRTLGMSAIEGVLSENGYLIVSPEDYTIREQFLYIHNAKRVICEAGSALHLFDALGPQKSELVVMSRRGFDARYWRDLYGSRVSRFLAFDKALPMHNYFGTTAGAGHSLYHIELLTAFLKDLGLSFNQAKLLAEIREAVSHDIKTLNVGFF